MSQTVIFTVGIVVFALTVWGSVMVGGYWLGQLDESKDEQAEPGTGAPPPPPASSPSP